MAAVMNKRKRESNDIAPARAAPNTSLSSTFDLPQMSNDDDGDTGMDFATAFAHHTGDTADSHMQGQGGDGQSASDTAAAAMAQFHTMTVPQSTEQTFLAQGGNKGGEPSSASAQQRTSSFGDFGVGESSPNGDTSPLLGSGSKPAVGSEEWHKVRKDNHKEVERRRRETINEGINELAKIVPGTEKNKGSILIRAVEFIRSLKDNEANNIEKWTLEKMLTEQALGELSSSCDKLKAECQRAWTEVEQLKRENEQLKKWKRTAQKDGVTVDDDEDGDDDGDNAD